MMLHQRYPRLWAPAAIALVIFVVLLVELPLHLWWLSLIIAVVTPLPFMIYEASVRSIKEGRVADGWRLEVQPRIEGLWISIKAFRKLRHLLREVGHEQPVRETEIFLVTRRHWMSFWIRAWWPVFKASCFAFAPAVILFRYSSYSVHVSPQYRKGFPKGSSLRHLKEFHLEVLAWIGVVLILLGLLYIAWKLWRPWIRWRYTFYIVTNLNFTIVFQPPERLTQFFKPETGPSYEIDKIWQDEFDATFFSTWFGWLPRMKYGTLHLGTPLQENEEQKIHSIPHFPYPEESRRLIDLARFAPRGMTSNA
jgi:hypothetical protein